MAGFINTMGGSFNSSSIGKRIKNLSRLGMKYDDLILKNSRSIGITEAEYGNMLPFSGGFDNEDMWQTFASLSLSDIRNKKDISFFKKDYVKKRDELREFSMHDEVEEILDTMTDESIVYDTKNFFAYPDFVGGGIKDTIKNSLELNFKKIYYAFNFNDGISAWNYFRKWLIFGFLAFEIIYDNLEKPKNIIGFKEIDPAFLKPDYDKESKQKIWILYPGEGKKEKKLWDSQVIYLSWASINSPSRVSYLERLIRSFNLLRIMEHTRIIWAVMNASYRMKFVIPVGGKSKTRAKQSLAQVMHNYREVVTFDYEAGMIETNGKPMMQFNKEYWLPSKDGEEPQIETLGGEGPELSDTETLKYFNDKLKMASKIPFNRFDKDSPAGYEIAAEGMLREEIKFSKFITRIRSIFQEMLVKPLYIQMMLSHPELEKDETFRVNISIKYNKENVFEEMKQFELINKRVEFIANMKDSLTETDANMNEEPYWDLDFLIKRWGNFTDDDIKSNKIYKRIKELTKDGYSDEDAQRIAYGEPKDKFTPVKNPEPEPSDMGAF